MTDEVAATPTIWEALDAWSKELPDWQQYIVRTAMAQGTLTEEQVEEAYRFFLTAKGLVENKEPLPVIPPALSRPQEVLDEKLLLKAVDSLVGINALPGDASLTFGEQLTVIYGENGTGKSGFSRLLSNACFSRQVPQILENIYDEEETGQSAKFHVALGESPATEVDFPVEDEENPLRRITVFDTDVAHHHITGTSSFSFKPAGFDVFEDVCDVYGELDEKLRDEISRRTPVNSFTENFTERDTTIYSRVATLGADTDLPSLRLMAQAGPVEKARVRAIENEIAELVTKSSEETKRNLQEAKGDMDALADDIEALEEVFTAVRDKGRKAMITKAKDTQAAANLLGADTFKRPFFKAVASDEWTDFAESVHSLAKVEGERYPTKASRCLLCEQPLSVDSAEHIKALLAFVEGDARQAAQDAKSVVEDEREEIRQLDVSIFSASSRVRSHLHKLDSALEGEVSDVMKTLSAYKVLAATSLESLESKPALMKSSGVPAKLRAVSKGLAEKIRVLDGANPDALIKKLGAEKKLLRHAALLKNMLPRIEVFVAEAKWVQQARQAIPSLNTKPVTDKGNALAKEILNDAYKARFQEECVGLSCSIPVEQEMSGSRGETIHSLVISGGWEPDEILSEGEKRAVAIADFLTEVGLNPASAGIILDDPVSSLDIKRKEYIAERLVKEAKTRQVIIFTHDLVFLTLLQGAAKTWGVNVVGHCIETDADGAPGQVSLNDSPGAGSRRGTIEDAEKHLATSLSLKGSERQDALALGMKALRVSIEDAVAKKLFKEVVQRWSNRVMVTSLKKVVWDGALITETIDLFEKLSPPLHTSTDENPSPAPTPEFLKLKIAEVRELVRKM